MRATARCGCHGVWYRPEDPGPAQAPCGVRYYTEDQARDAVTVTGPPVTKSLRYRSDPRRGSEATNKGNIC